MNNMSSLKSHFLDVLSTKHSYHNETRMKTADLPACIEHIFIFHSGKMARLDMTIAMATRTVLWVMGIGR